MTNANNDVRELEDLLTELEGQGALPVGAYAEEDDAVTQLMDAPLGEQEWMVQITPQDRRMMSTDQLLAELLTGHLVTRDMLVWRSGMGDWAPISRVDELRSGASLNVPLPPPAPAPRSLAVAPLPPPTPIPPPRVPTGQSSALSSPSPLGRAPLPPAPSVPFAAPKPFTPVPDVPPPSALPLLSSPFGSSPAPVVPSKPSAALLPDLESAFNVPPAAPPPVPPPAVARVNTQRPVAVDFSEMEPTRSAPMRVLVGSGIAALLMIAGTVYGLSAGGVFSSGAEPTPEVAAASAKPAPAKPAAAPEAPKPAEPAPAAAAAVAAEPAKEEPQTQPVSMKEEPAAAAEEKKAEAAAPEEKAAKEPEAKAEVEEPEAKAEKPSKAEKAAKSGEKAEEKAEASDDGAAPSSAAEQRMARRLKALSKKKASAAAASDDAEASASPRRSSKPRAAAAAPEVARAEESEEAPKDKVTTTDPAGSTFNRGAAKTALENAATQAKNCRPQGGPSGSGRVQVRYEPNGKVGAVSILSPQFENTTTGSCVVMVFRRASIPAFTGSPAVSMNHNFEIPSN